MVACSLYLIPESSSTHHYLLRTVPWNLNARCNSASDDTDSVGLLVMKWSWMCHWRFNLRLSLHLYVCYHMAWHDQRNYFPICLDSKQDRLLLSLHRASWYKSFTFTNRCTYLLVLESTKIYIKIHTKMLLHVSVCDHHHGVRTWAWLKLQLLKVFGKNKSLCTCSGVAALLPHHCMYITTYFYRTF